LTSFFACEEFSRTLDPGQAQAADVSERSRHFEYILFPVVLAVLGVFVPCIPTSTMAIPDPVDRTDERVRIDLTEQDIREAMRVVRKGRFNSVYEIVRFDTRKPLLMITESRESGSVSAMGLDVMVGEICGELCGSGEHYHLEKTEGRWHLVGISEWVS